MTAPASQGGLRLFFALDPDPETRRRIHQVGRALDLDGRPVPAGRLHATLAFLGETPAHRLTELRHLAGDAGLSPVRVSLDRVGSFPRSRVAWLGTTSLPAGLAGFRQRLAERLAEAGFAVDRNPWTLHVTLYRDLRTRSPTLSVDPVQWDVDRFVLMESSTGPGGLRYRVRGHWPAKPETGRRSPR